MRTVDISVVIVSWNVRDLLRDCLQSVAAGDGGLTVQVVVVDGASADGSAAMVASEFPDVELIACDENVGFPRGNNLGMAAATGRYLLLLNPDTIISSDTLQTCFTYMEENQQVGICGAQLRYADGSVQSSRRRFPTVVTGLFESTWLEPIAPQSVLEQYRMLDSGDDEIVDADWVMGAYMFTRRAAYEQVGGMDEAYFMYSEELDWCRRMKEASWRIVYLPTTFIVHYEGKSSSQAVTARHVNFQRAKLRYFRKYHGAGITLLLRIVLLTNYLVQIAIEACKGIVGHKRPLRWQRVGAYWSVVKSGLRPAGY